MSCCSHTMQSAFEMPMVFYNVGWQAQCSSLSVGKHSLCLSVGKHSAVASQYETVVVQIMIVPLLLGAVSLR